MCRLVKKKFQRIQKSTKWHLPLGCAYNFVHQKKNHETARALVSCCAVMISCEIFSRIGATSYQNARKASAARALGSLRGLFCLNFEAPCRFRILIISLIRENWAINFGEMKDHG